MKLVLILPYFGALKNYFNLFIKTFSYNSEIDLLMITDNIFEDELPQNVRVINMSFEDFRELTQSKFDFDINLNKPYKLCDYKPAYGYICEEWIKDYDYWGHCDCDLLFGDLTPVISILKQGYDKIFAAGHMTIYKNTEENNRVFMREHSTDGYIYRKVFSSDRIFAFDEVYFKVNVGSLFAEAGKRIFEEDKSYNVSTKRSMITRTWFEPASRKWLPEKGRNDQLYWQNGHIYRVRYQKLRQKRDEFIYIHMQSRKMAINSKIMDCSTIRILPHEFKEVDKLPDTLVSYLSQVKLYINYQLIKSRIYAFLNRNKRDYLRYGKPWEYDPYLEK